MASSPRGQQPLQRGRGIELRAEQIVFRRGDAQIARQRARGVHSATGTRKPTAWYSLFSITMRMWMRGKLPALAVAVDVPASVHQQMRGQNAAAGKMNQQPFAARLHAVDGLARRAACRR